MNSLYIVHETLSSTFLDENSNNGSPSDQTPNVASKPIQFIRCVSDGYDKFKEPKTARPSNAFILYRAAKHSEIKNFFKNAGQKIPFEKDVSKIIGGLWKKENEATHAYYKRQADIVAAKHQKENPKYKYQPMQKKNIQGVVKQTHSVTKKKTTPQKSTQPRKYEQHIIPSAEKNNDECLRPTSLPSQCLSQDDLRCLISDIDFHNLDISLYNDPNTMNTCYQDLGDTFFDFLYSNSDGI